MRFGPVPVGEAAGAILAHSQALPAGGRLRKGLVLGDDHVRALSDAGQTDVIVARLERDDVGEDAAATRIATALRGPGLRAAAAATGRVNLFAEMPGVMEVDPAAVSALNAVDPMVTLATVPRWRRVSAGEMVATVKIIAYGVAETSVMGAEAAAPGALRLWSPVLRRAILIETTVDGRVPSPKGRAATQARLRRLGVALAPRVVVAHRTAEVAAAISAAAAMARDDLILILTASATSDPADVGPAAVIAAGGRIDRFGMPVDPGNLLFLGALGGRPVIGLPGCARSPALNGADWVLERMICGIAVTAADIAGMGVGGLLKEVAARGRLRQED